jgi:hypothetical protein
MNTLEEIRRVADLIPDAVTALRGLAPRSTPA